MPRTEVVERILPELDDRTCVISSLGYLSRDVYASGEGLRERCFYCMGSMGSVIPLALGIALARPARRVLALEGDGSLLMNLGTLATVARYGPENLGIVLFDNRCYESSGGQPSQPEGFRIEDVCRAAGLPTVVVDAPGDLVPAVRAVLGPPPRPARLLVAKVAPAPARPRIEEAPGRISSRFARWLNGGSDDRGGARETS